MDGRCRPFDCIKDKNMIPNIKKVYFEITNVCNLSCSFCPGTKRPKGFVSVEEFRLVAQKLSGRIPYMYLHLMGEPTIHPRLPEILDISQKCGFKTIITTNGTTLKDRAGVLLGAGKPYKISISLHSFEANSKGEPNMDEYLDSCFEFAAEAAKEGVICVFRLWNLDGANTEGANSENRHILTRMRQFFDDGWSDTRSGMRISDKIFLEYGEKFEWPEPGADSASTDTSDFFCHGLRDQIGILCDGTVVPCCLDSEGSIALGNVFNSDIEEILNSERAKEFYRSVSSRRCPSSICESCGYAARFSKNKN